MAPLPPMRPSRGARTFKTVLRGFACEDLPASGNGSYYLRIEVGGKRAFQTQQSQGPDPAWNFEAGFYYAPSEKLGLGELWVDCLSSADGRSVGQASVDLGTVACGPAAIRLSLRDGQTGVARGAVVFDCSMREFSDELTVICQDISLRMSGLRGSAHLQVRPTLGDMFSTDQVTMVQQGNGMFRGGPCAASLEASLGDLLQAPNREGLRFSVIDASGKCRGEASLAFRRAFSAEPDAMVPFNVQVLGPEDAEGRRPALGSLEGALVYRGLPSSAQMVGGLCVDGRAEGGWLLHEGLHFPCSMEQPPPLWQDTASSEGPDLFSVDAPPGDAFSKISDFDDQALLEVLEQIPLPRPWEMRWARAGHKSSAGRVYFADARSRRSTWTDPRLLPQDWDQRIDMQTGKVYFAYHPTRQTTFADPRGCPPSWDMRLSRSGDVYFAHHSSQQTTCLDPRGLPEHIEAALDEHGRVYFKNHDNAWTTWDDPRAGEQEESLEEWLSAELARWWTERLWKYADARGCDEMDLAA